MIHISDLEKFCSIINNFKSSGILVKLFGNKKEDFVGAYTGFDRPANNALLIKIVAMTSVGTIYCNEVIRFSNSESVEKANTLFASLDITDIELSYDKQSGTISFK